MTALGKYIPKTVERAGHLSLLLGHEPCWGAGEAGRWNAVGGLHAWGGLKWVPIAGPPPGYLEAAEAQGGQVPVL